MYWHSGLIVCGLNRHGDVADQLRMETWEELAEDLERYDCVQFECRSSEVPSEIFRVFEELESWTRVAEFLLATPVVVGARYLRRRDSSPMWDDDLFGDQTLFSFEGHEFVDLGNTDVREAIKKRLPQQEISPYPLTDEDIESINRHRVEIKSLLLQAHSEHLYSYRDSIRETSASKKIRAAYECISSVVASSPGDTGYKVAMRAAGLLGRGPDERTRLYKVFKRVGAVRNALAHPNTTQARKALDALVGLLDAATDEVAAHEVLNIARLAIEYEARNRNTLKADAWEELLDLRLLVSGQH
jgi:hypothetical protein